jgi:hypothetical protein
MTQSQTTPAAQTREASPVIRLRLYIASVTPTSLRAVANLDAILKELEDSAPRILVEKVDVAIHPLQALADRIIVTPTLMQYDCENTAPPVIGDLSDAQVVRSFIENALRQAAKA